MIVQVLFISAVATVLVLIAPHVGILGVGSLVLYGAYSVYMTWYLAVMHLFMSQVHTMKLSPDMRATAMGILEECRTSYPKRMWLIVDIILDLIQVISLFYFEFYAISVMIGVGHLLGYSVYFRLPSFYRSIENGPTR